MQQYSAPSKTFLIGEYSVLLGGPALVINTEPRFGLVVDVESHLQEVWADDSPASRLLQQFTRGGHKGKYSFLDPHEGRGGFGASSAQFLLLYASQAPELLELSRAIRNVSSHASFTHLTPTQFSYVFALWSAYRDINGPSRLPPSGVDVVAQFIGKLAWVDLRHQSLALGSWLFSDLSFLLIRTGVKVSTHEHLEEMSYRLGPKGDENLNGHVRTLETLTQNAYAALSGGNSEDLIASIEEAHVVLGRAGLVAETTRELLAHMRERTGVLAVKGCGALGADTVFALVQRSEKSAIRDWVLSRGLEVIADELALSHGLAVSEVEPIHMLSFQPESIV